MRKRPVIAKHNNDRTLSASPLGNPDQWQNPGVLSKNSVPLPSKALKGHAGVIEKLIQLGSKAIDTPDNDGCTPMHDAAFGGHANVIETLVRLGSNAIDALNNRGCTPMFVVLSDHPLELTEDEVVELRFGVYFGHSLAYRLLFELDRRDAACPPR